MAKNENVPGSGAEGAPTVAKNENVHGSGAEGAPTSTATGANRVAAGKVTVRIGRQYFPPGSELPDDLAPERIAAMRAQGLLA